MIHRSIFFYTIGLFLIFIMFYIPDLYAEDIQYEVISEGYLDTDDRMRSMVLKDKEILEKFLQNKNLNNGSAVNFDTDTVALIVPDNSSYPDTVVIENIVKNSTGVINVDFSLNSFDYVPQENEKAASPYKLIRIYPAGKDLTSVSFKKTGHNKNVFANNSVDNLIKYTNVMEDNRENLFLNYLPLDKGNSWTYDLESPAGKGSQTFSIVTYTNGWSIFDTYFGMSDVALRLDRGGHIHVSSNSGNRPFYTPDVLVSYPEYSYKSDAGEFKDIMVVTSGKNSAIEFKDIYARDIGLVYHEHRTKDGMTKYFLTNAYVRGLQLP